MKRLILGACLTLLFIAGLFRVQFVPVAAQDANPANNPAPSTTANQPLVTPDTEDASQDPPPTASDIPTIQLYEALVGDTSDFTMSTAVIRVVNALTGEPMPGVSATVESVYRGNPVAESLSLVADKQGLLKFQYPNKIKILMETLQRGGQFPQEQRNRSAIYECKISIEPSQQGGRMLLASRINLGMVFPSDTIFSNDRVPTIKMREGHLLVGRVINARNQAPLAASDDGKPIRIAFLGSAYEGEAETYPRSGSPVLEVDDNGIFQCYLPEGVCWPFIMPNGDDQIWPRTLAYQQWQKEGVLIKPGKITTVEFRVTPRLDSENAAPTLPVLEEQLAAAKLTMLGGQYELDENRRVSKTWIDLESQNRWPLLREFKFLTTLDISNAPVVLWTDDELQRILELPALTTLEVLPLELDLHLEQITLEGREEIEKYLKEEVPKQRAKFEERSQRSIEEHRQMMQGIPNGGMGGMMYGR